MQAVLDKAAHHWKASMDREAVQVPAFDGKPAYLVAQNGIKIIS